MNLDEKQKKFLFVGAGIILGVILISKWLHALPKKQDEVSDTTPLDLNKILKKGSQGIEVSELQIILKKDYNANLGDTGVNKDGIDGDFGLLTEVALKSAKGVTEISLKDL